MLKKYIEIWNGKQIKAKRKSNRDEIKTNFHDDVYHQMKLHGQLSQWYLLISFTEIIKSIIPKQFYKNVNIRL